MTELLPCPFCGSDALVRHCHHSMPRPPTFLVSCTYCGGSTASEFRTEAEAVRLWNIRSLLPKEEGQ